MLHHGTQFCYVESTVTEDCRSECEVKRRIALAMEAFSKKKYLMCESLSLQLKKKRTVKAYVWNIALYMEVRHGHYCKRVT